MKERKQSQDPAAFARTKQSPIEVRVDNSPSVLNEDGSTDTAGLNNNEALLSDADVTLAPEVKSEEDKKDLWMDFEDFFHCFRYIYTMMIVWYVNSIFILQFSPLFHRVNTFLLTLISWPNKKRIWVLF